jgi:MFS family permease
VQIGFIATASLLGTAVLTLVVGLIAPRHDLRNMLLLAAGLMAFTGVALPGSEYLAYIAMVAFVGTINPSSGDIGVVVPLEHSMLARHAADEERTRIFARYSLIGALSMAAGALAAGLADVFVAWGFTRPAYVMAVVTPAERTAAASVTAVPRSLASAISPTLAGVLLTFPFSGLPLVVCGSLKIIYDLALLYTFRHVKPPEEKRPVLVPEGRSRPILLRRLLP